MKITIRIEEQVEHKEDIRTEVILLMTVGDPKVAAGALRSLADKYDQLGSPLRR